MMLPSRLGCPLSLKTPNMGNTGQVVSANMTRINPLKGHVDDGRADYAYVPSAQNWKRAMRRVVDWIQVK